MLNDAASWRGALRRRFPLLLLLAVIVALWYAAAVPLNRDAVLRTAQGAVPEGLDFAKAAWNVDRPVLPAPHQVVRDLWDSTVGWNVTSKRSLVYHAAVTLASAALGFSLGLLLGVVLAAGIVLHRGIDRSLMPWVIVSQTVPILALAPMIIVVLASIGFTGLLPKSVISMYLSFFPVTVGMVKGLRSADPVRADLMRSYSAASSAVFWKLRIPSSVPFMFGSMKVAAAAALVGAIVGELPTGARGGLGSRLLTASYYGQTVQIWSALFMAAAVGAMLVATVGLAERIVAGRMQFANE